MNQTLLNLNWTWWYYLYKHKLYKKGYNAATTTGSAEILTRWKSSRFCETRESQRLKHTQNERDSQSQQGWKQIKARSEWGGYMDMNMEMGGRLPGSGWFKSRSWRSVDGYYSLPHSNNQWELGRAEQRSRGGPWIWHKSYSSTFYPHLMKEKKA